MLGVLTGRTKRKEEGNQRQREGKPEEKAKAILVKEGADSPRVTTQVDRFYYFEIMRIVFFSPNKTDHTLLNYLKTSLDAAANFPLVLIAVSRLLCKCLSVFSLLLYSENRSMLLTAELSGGHTICYRTPCPYCG